MTAEVVVGAVRVGGGNPLALMAGPCVIEGESHLLGVGERLLDPGLAAREARAVAEFARQELTWERAALAMEAVYREALPSRKGAA